MLDPNCSSLLRDLICSINQVDVYLDAVLYPNCIRDKQTFEQEGWHHELEDPAENVTFKVQLILTN